MNNEFNLRAYKEAKTILPHIDAILALLNLAMRGLLIFKSYTPVFKILTVMEEQKQILSLHQQRLQQVLVSKGQIK